MQNTKASNEPMSGPFVIPTSEDPPPYMVGEYEVPHQNSNEFIQQNITGAAHFPNR